MVLVALKTDILKQLCSEDQLELLDAVDGLRSQGIDSYVSLPQIIVCGDQSSGKSSVLEAISGVPFPVNSSLCTRFPTELVLRKTTEIGVSISIVPDLSHGDGESVDRALSFHEKLENFNELPQLIEKAKAAMAITTTGKSFSRDLLRIEISGPDRPHLTIVDLPGLIHSETKHQSASDIELVQDVVRTYMEERRSIILAVISAKNDYANQIVLKLARAADKEGHRTLGVITKPDTLVRGSASENTFVSLAQNEDVNFRLGWHVLKNLDSDIGAGSLTKRDLEEQEFFSRGAWKTLPNACLGIEALRERLSALLLAQIANELPSLIKEIDGKLQLCRTHLKRLGEPRITQDEQRLYLIQLSELYQSITKAAVDGSYNHAFFGDAKSDVGYQKRLRAVIQNLNGSFANTIVTEGHRYNITDTLPEMSVGTSDTGPVAISRTKYMDLVEQLIERTRGRELPGTYNPMVIADLFVEQSQPWEAIVMKHSEAVTRAVERFLRHLVGHIADKTTYEQLFRAVFDPALQELVEDLNQKLSKLLAEHQKGHPITYNRRFTDAVDGLSEARLEQKLTSIILDNLGVSSLSGTYYNISDFRPLLTALLEYTKPILTRPACSRALDCMETYYKIALTRFIDDVSVEAVEASMMSKLHEILRPAKVAMMTTQELTKIAGESQKGRNRRLELQTQITILTGGIKTCKRIVSIGLPGPSSIKGLSAGRRDMTPDTEDHPEPSIALSIDDMSAGEEVVVVEPEDDVPEAPASLSDAISLVDEQPAPPVVRSYMHRKKKGKKRSVYRSVSPSDN